MRRSCIYAAALLFAVTPAAADGDSVKIEYIAHAAFRITSPAGTRLLIDPYASRVWLGYDFPENIAAEAVLITHPHYDHDGGEYRGLPVPWTEGTRVLRFPGKFALGDITVTGFKGRHVNPYGKEFGQFNTVWRIDVAGISIVHLGDNEMAGPALLAALKKAGPVDVLMIPVDADDHILTGAEVAATRAALGPAYVIPMHYRIPVLEKSADSPRDLGEIGPWIEGKTALQMNGNSFSMTKDSLPSKSTILLLQHAPELRPAKAD